jgi:hypothetical protein
MIELVWVGGRGWWMKGEERFVSKVGRANCLTEGVVLKPARIRKQLAGVPKIVNPHNTS